MNDVALIVTSCDKYSVAWNTFAYAIKKYWSDCPYKIYFITNFKDAPIGESIKVGIDKGWSNKILSALEHINESVLLMMVEDYWLCEKVDTSQIEDLTNLVIWTKADQIRLIPSGEVIIKNKMDIIKDDAYYMASLQPSIWGKDYFKNFVRPNETVWQFEQRGNLRTVKGSINLSVKEPMIKIWPGNVIQQGIWTDDGKKYAEKEGIIIDMKVNPNDNI